LVFPHALTAQPVEIQTSSTTITLGGSRVRITFTGGERLISANGIPNHPTGQFPGPGNPNKISAQDYNFRVPTSPEVADKPTPSQGAWFGVALNGIPFEPGTAEFWSGDRSWNYEAKSGFIDLGLDASNAHACTDDEAQAADCQGFGEEETARIITTVCQSV